VWSRSCWRRSTWPRSERGAEVQRQRIGQAEGLPPPNRHPVRAVFQIVADRTEGARGSPRRRVDVEFVAVVGGFRDRKLPSRRRAFDGFSSARTALLSCDTGSRWRQREADRAFRPAVQLGPDHFAPLPRCPLQGDSASVSFMLAQGCSRSRRDRPRRARLEDGFVVPNTRVRRRRTGVA
jgi:hypothetical protein